MNYEPHGLLLNCSIMQLESKEQTVHAGRRLDGDDDKGMMIIYLEMILGDDDKGMMII
jgi:hypothetical protein